MIQSSFAARSLPEQLSLFPKPPRLLPRFIRMRDAPGYLGMDKNRFNRDVRPQLAEIPIGTQGVAFDRLDLASRGST
jgi:hypothetical protein